MRHRAPIKDLKGKKFNKLTALEFVGRDKNGYILWRCICDCGIEKIVKSKCLVHNNVKSCGCLIGHSNPGTHRDTNSREYKIWGKMVSRCTNPNDRAYKHYLGRGITVCDRWRRYENFIADMGRSTTIKHELDRIDNDGNYEPGNCRWATRKEQVNNMRRSLWVTLNNEKKTLSQWRDIYHFKYETVRCRLIKGMSPEKAFGINQIECDHDK